jgi:hypothetical protein
MNPLNNYFQWTECFDAIEKWDIGHIDTETEKALEQGTISWTPGVADRFTNSLLVLINGRLDKLNKFFSTRIKTAVDEFSISQVLIIYRKELIFLKKLCSLKTIPKETSEKLVKEIVDCAKKAQNNLDDTAKKDISGVLKRVLSGIRIDNI